MKFRYYLPTRIEFGVGALGLVGEEARKLGARALIVVSRGGSMRRAGVLERVEGLLHKEGVEAIIFDKVQPNPIASAVDEGARLARDEGCDLVIGLGGGSPLDSAKCIAFMAKSPGRYWDYVQSGSGGRKIPREALPLIVIPTTAGTGTEADPFAVITNPETKEKIGIGFELIFPRVSLVDPQLMLTVPQDQTAYTGMDAFYHALEAYLNLSHQPASDLLALEAIRLITEYLPRAYKDGEDLEARTKLAWASTAAGICETLSGCIGNHSMEHPVSGHYPGIPHGAGLAALGPAFFEYILPYARERLAQVAQVMSEETEGLSPDEAAQRAISALRNLQSKVGLGEANLRRLGVKEEILPRLAEDALTTMGGLLAVTPGNLGKDDLLEIYRRALDYSYDKES
ncbi:MAG: iron-containing alcohol dehydrogenase [Candidatus Bipolaricaulia bacterium]